MNIICFGDSITEAAEVPDPARWTTLLQGALDEWRPGATRVFNLGVGGNTSAQAFDRFDSDVLPLLPGLLLVQFGFNDSNVRDWASVPRVGLQEFRKNLETFHRVATQQHGHCMFIVNHPIARSQGRQGNGRSYNQNFQPYNDTVRELAACVRAPIIDLPAWMSAHAVNLSELLAPDGLHLTEAGNRRYAAAVFAGLQPVLTAWMGAS